VKETAELAQSGVKEINLIAQDLTAYGRDRKDGTTLERLLREMTQVPHLEWIRLLYAYPNFLDPSLLELIRDNDKICKYIDIPFQHISRSILQRMRRGKSGSAVREAVHTLRDTVPGLTLRTSLIVGFPGETDADFEELLEFVEEAQFERLGVFKYSEEEGTAAARMATEISEEEKEQRWQELMDLQSQISRKKNEALIGSIQRVIIDEVAVESDKATGRTQGHAPEVDGTVYVESRKSLRERAPIHGGDMIDVKITGALDYDLISEIINA
jgi:ribosomal protein S12 methylthiotransferase